MPTVFEDSKFAAWQKLMKFIGGLDQQSARLDVTGTFWTIQARRSYGEDWGDLNFATLAEDWESLATANLFEDWQT